MGISLEISSGTFDVENIIVFFLFNDLNTLFFTMAGPSPTTIVHIFLLKYFMRSILIKEIFSSSFFEIVLYPK
jgi:hypothetical protein